MKTFSFWGELSLNTNLSCLTVHWNIFSLVLSIKLKSLWV